MTFTTGQWNTSLESISNDRLYASVPAPMRASYCAFCAEDIAIRMSGANGLPHTRFEGQNRKGSRSRVQWSNRWT